MTWEDAAGSVLPVLGGVFDGPDDAISVPAMPMLRERVQWAVGQGRDWVTAAQCASWGVDVEEVFKRARANLSDRAVEGLVARKEWGLWQVAADEGPAANRLLLRGWLGAFEGQVAGRPVAVVPSPRVLLVGGDGARGQIERLVQLGWDAYRQAASPLSPVPYTVDNGRVVPWRGEGTPFAEPVEAAIGLLAASTYGAQRERLVGNGVAVPVVQLVREGGRAFTVATWSPQDRATWLPEVDVIDVSGVGRVAWSDVLRFARGALERLPIEPVRYSARWPSPATLEAMRAVSVR